MALNLKMITPIASEPLSLADVKEHLRLDAASYADSITSYQSIVPGSHAIAAAYSLVGTAVDVLGKRAVVNFNAGTCGTSGKIDVKIQESSDNITFSDWTGGAFTQVSEATDNAIFEKEYTGTKQYIRVVCTIAGAACEFSVDILVNSAYTIEDTLLTNLIKQAREYGESVTGHAFAPQTIDYYLPEFPFEDEIEWPMGPLTSVTGVYYKDYLGVVTTMTASTQYVVDADTFPGKIFLPYGVYWPSFTPYPKNSVRIRGVCGYTGTAPYILPDNFRQAMLLHIGLLYNFRESNLIPANSLDAVYRLYASKREEWF